MALQQFVQQSEQSSSTEPEETPVHLGSHQKDDDAKVQEASNSASFSSSALNAVAPAVGNKLVSSAPIALTMHDREVLSSLAAVQIRYNRPAEAVPYLMMLRKTDRNDHQAARLLALALMKLGNWEQAELILEDINDTEEGDTTIGIIAFYRSIVAFKQRKISIARQWLQQFRSLVSGGSV